jgi:hypothetical protein
MTATRDIRLLVCDEQSACRDEVRESALVAEDGFWVYFDGFRGSWNEVPPSGLSHSERLEKVRAGRA